MIKYKAAHGKIKPIEVIREADNYVFVNQFGAERMLEKFSEDHSFFNTFGEAKAFLIAEAKKDIKRAQGQIRVKHAQLQLIRNIAEQNKVEVWQNKAEGETGNDY